jgi:hypothetical protein
LWEERDQQLQGNQRWPLAPRKRALPGIDLIPSYQAIETIPYHSKKKKKKKKFKINDCISI